MSEICNGCIYNNTKFDGKIECTHPQVDITDVYHTGACSKYWASLTRGEIYNNNLKISSECSKPSDPDDELLDKVLKGMGYEKKHKPHFSGEIELSKEALRHLTGAREYDIKTIKLRRYFNVQDEPYRSMSPERKQDYINSMKQEMARELADEFVRRCLWTSEHIDELLFIETELYIAHPLPF